MARPSGVGAVVAMVIATLRASAPVTALVPAARIVADVEPGTPRPHLVVDVEDEQADDVLSAGGIDAIVRVLVVSEYRGAAEIGLIATQVREALDGRALAVTGFADLADVTYEQAASAYVEEIAGVVVRHRPLWFRVRVI